MSQRLTCAVMASSSCDVKSVFDEHQPFVWSLSCRDNRTLNFYLVDKLTQWSFLQHLGLHQEDQRLPNAIIISLPGKFLNI